MNYISKSDLKKLVAQGDIDELIRILSNGEKAVFDKDTENLFIILSAKYKEYKKHVIIGDQSIEALKIDNVQILYGFLELINDLKYDKIPINSFTDKEDIQKTNLFSKIYENKYWDILEKCVREASVAGGITAMGYYKESWSLNENIEKNVSNPSTIADVEATLSLLKVIDSTLPKICEELECDLQYFGEETGSKTQEIVFNRISPIISSKIKSEEEFFTKKKNTIRVIFDAIDGTGNFKKGFPVFCSAIAILINDQPRISAIYDPVHHIVYSGVLSGPEKYPYQNKAGSIWHVSIGQNIEMLEVDKSKRLCDENIGIHFTRSKKNKEQLKEMIDHVENLVDASAGVYAINSGLFSLAEVARGSLGGFINNRTNSWDVAAGEVLIKSVGGIVTDLKKKEIDYSKPGQLSVVAAPTQSLYNEIIEVINI